MKPVMDQPLKYTEKQMKSVICRKLMRNNTDSAGEQARSRELLYLQEQEVGPPLLLQGGGRLTVPRPAQGLGSQPLHSLYGLSGTLTRSLHCVDTVTFDPSPPLADDVIIKASLKTI